MPRVYILNETEVSTLISRSQNDIADWLDEAIRLNPSAPAITLLNGLNDWLGRPTVEQVEENAPAAEYHEDVAEIPVEAVEVEEEEEEVVIEPEPEQIVEAEPVILEEPPVEDVVEPLELELPADADEDPEADERALAEAADEAAREAEADREQDAKHRVNVRNILREVRQIDKSSQ